MVTVPSLPVPAGLPVSADTGDIIRAAAPTMISSRIIFQNPDGLLLVCLDIRKCIDIYNIKSYSDPWFLR
jgi:hypothetical protein